jgi:hypothetical protein
MLAEIAGREFTHILNIYYSVCHSPVKCQEMKRKRQIRIKTIAQAVMVGKARKNRRVKRRSGIFIYLITSSIALK